MMSKIVLALLPILVVSTATGGGSTTGISGLTTSTLKTVSTFANASPAWNITTDPNLTQDYPTLTFANSGAVWVIGTGSGGSNGEDSGGSSGGRSTEVRDAITNATNNTTKTSQDRAASVAAPAATNTGDLLNGDIPNVYVQNGGIALAPANPPIPDTISKISLASIGGQTAGYSLTITGSSVTISLPDSGSASVDSPAPVEGKNVAVVAVGEKGEEAVVDRYDVNSTGSSLTVTSAATTDNQIRAKMPKDNAANAQKELFKLANADGRIAEFSVTYADGAISIKPLNTEAAKLADDNGAGLKVLTVTGMVTVQDKLGVAVNTISAVYINKP